MCTLRRRNLSGPLEWHEGLLIHKLCDYSSIGLAGLFGV